MLAGTGLLYARTGTFDVATMGEAVARTGSDPVLTAGFVLLAGALLTKAAVLRAAARIFGGASGVPGPELPAPTEREREKLDRPLWLMALPALVLVALALALAKAAMPFLGAVAARLSDSALPPPALPEAGWGNLAPCF